MKMEEKAKEISYPIGKALYKYSPPQKRILTGIPMTGLLRAEWVLARYGQIIPCNWSMVDMIQFVDQYSPIQFLVADARNVISTRAVEEEFEWLWFIDHDVILPPGTLIRWNERMQQAKVPVFGGLYFAKGVPSEPLTYRGRGNSYYKSWKMGDEVWVDGMGMGNTMIHVSILKALYEESEEYEIIKGVKAKKIFETPSKVFFDPEKGTWGSIAGTEDLEWCTRVMKQEIFAKAGWPKYQKKKYPFLVDTSIFSMHIDFDGRQFPTRGEHLQFVRKSK